MKHFSVWVINDPCFWHILTFVLHSRLYEMLITSLVPILPKLRVKILALTWIALSKHSIAFLLEPSLSFRVLRPPPTVLEFLLSTALLLCLHHRLIQLSKRAIWVRCWKHSKLTPFSTKYACFPSFFVVFVLSLSLLQDNLVVLLSGTSVQDAILKPNFVAVVGICNADLRVSEDLAVEKACQLGREIAWFMFRPSLIRPRGVFLYSSHSTFHRFCVDAGGARTPFKAFFTTFFKWKFSGVFPLLEIYFDHYLFLPLLRTWYDSDSVHPLSDLSSPLCVAFAFIR